MSAQIACHMLGDYVIQSDWMAQEKIGAHLPAAAHAVSYALPFLALTRDPRRLAVIAGTHFIIDRWRLARYVVWAKNQVAPKRYRYSLPPAGTGYHPDRDVAQPWMTVWLMIAADNALHLAINAAALS